MVEREKNDRREIVDLLPAYAHTRRSGWNPETTLPGQFPLSEYLLLRRVAIVRGDAPVPLHELRAHALNPYSTVDRSLDGLPRLVQQRLLDSTKDSYLLAAKGRDLLMRGEPAANDYAAGRYVLPPADFERLAVTLTDITTRQHRATEPMVKAHQDRVPYLRRFDSRQSSAVLLEYAIYALQRARDDAHIAAWRNAEFTGPMIDLLSRVWTEGTVTAETLTRQAQGRMLASDVAETVEHLERAGHVAVSGTTITITHGGKYVRDAIEVETDRVYFAPWPAVDASWICDQLKTVATQLSNHPSAP